MGANSNFCTLNSNAFYNPNITISHGGLKASTATNNRGVRAGWEVPDNDKWYWEVYCNTIAGSHQVVIGLQYEHVTTSDGQRGDRAKGVHYDSYNGNSRIDTGNDSTGSASYGASYATGDIIGVAVDRTNETITFYKNNSSQGSLDMSGRDYDKVFPFCGFGGGSSTQTVTFNFGQDSSFVGAKSTGSANAADANGFGDFYYSPPTDYKALCSGSWPIDEDIDPAQTDDNFAGQNKHNVVLYTGTGSTQSITGVGFQPDIVLIKCRDTSSTDYQWYDSVRGAQKVLEPNQRTGVEATDSNGLTAFGTAGFTVGSSSPVNQSTKTFVAWCWKAGGTTSTDSTGDITSTISADTEAGLSIVKYTGNGTNSASMAHGLGGLPEVIIFKRLSGGEASQKRWQVETNTSTPAFANVATDIGTGTSGYVHSKLEFSYNGQMGSSFYNPEQVALAGTTTTLWYDTQNNNGKAFFNNGDAPNEYISYWWREIEGFSKFGIYYANNNDDGPFVYTGFRPRTLWIKNAEGDDMAWLFADSAREVDNEMGNATIEGAPENGAESDPSGVHFDFYSNGFKMRDQDQRINYSTDRRFFYMCWGDQSLKYANAR